MAKIETSYLSGEKKEYERWKCECYHCDERGWIHDSFYPSGKKVCPVCEGKGWYWYYSELH